MNSYDKIKADHKGVRGAAKIFKQYEALAKKVNNPKTPRAEQRRLGGEMTRLLLTLPHTKHLRA